MTKAIQLSSWLVELGTYLGSQGVGVFGNTPTANIFLQQLPNSPKIAIGVYVGGGPNFPDGILPISKPTVQIVVRRPDSPLIGLQYATAVFNLIDSRWNITPSFGGRLVGDHGPGPFFLDAAGLAVYTLNFSGEMGRKD